MQGEEARIAAQVADGQAELMARFTLGMYEAANEGFFAGVDPLLGELLGRAALRPVLGSSRAVGPAGGRELMTSWR